MQKSTDQPERPWTLMHIWQIMVLRDLIWIALAVFLIWFGYQLRAIFTPVLIGLALAYLFHPLITWAEVRWKLPRPVTIAGILVFMSAMLLGMVIWLGPEFVTQIKTLGGAMPGYLQKLAGYLNFDISGLRATVEQKIKEIQADPGSFLADAASQLLAGTGTAFGLIGSVLSAAMYLLVTMLLIPIYFFFFAWQFGPMVRHFHQYIPASRRDSVMAIIGKMDRLVSTYFRARVIIALIMGVLLSVGWWAVGVPYWFLLGMISGLLGLMPYASIIGWPIAIGLKWLDVINGANAGAFSPAIFIAPSIVFFVVQALDGVLLTPLIQGRSLDMSIVTIIIVVFIGGAVGGLYGLLLCIPVAACIKVLLQDVFLPRLREWAAAN